MQVLMLLLVLLMLLVYTSKDLILTREVHATPKLNLSGGVDKPSKSRPSALRVRNRTAPNYYPSFIELLMDASLYNQLLYNHSVSRRLHNPNERDQRRASNQEQPTSPQVCQLLTTVINRSQMFFCKNHHTILTSVLDQVHNLTRRECHALAKDMRWNCSSISPFLDRSSILSYTKEAAFVRALLTTITAYIVTKECSAGMHSSCSCLRPSNSKYLDPNSYKMSNKLSNLPQSDNNFINRLTKLTRYQDCKPNIAIGTAFVQTYVDSDEVEFLKDAYQLLNEDKSQNHISENVDSKDSKYSGLLKWVKSTINLHNSHIGRKVFASSTTMKCRCHGLSGSCNLRTCWTELKDIRSITLTLKNLYLENSIQAYVQNFGSYKDPDFHLVHHHIKKEAAYSPLSQNYEHKFLAYIGSFHDIFISHRLEQSIPSLWINASQLVFIASSPDFCISQTNLKHKGTQGRRCYVKKRKKKSNSTSSLPSYTSISDEGSCEHLCCGRGFSDKLALVLEPCECRYEYCCKVQCQSCLRQRRIHYCL